MSDSNSSAVTCTSCSKPKAHLQCGICGSSLCKKCTQFLEEDTFAYLRRIPQDLMHTTYCEACFENVVSGELTKYQGLMAAAKEIRIFYNDQRRETRLVPRLEDPYSVQDCADEQEVLMRLAFWAAQAGFNSMLDVEVISKKNKVPGSQRMIWSGTGLPAQVDFDRLPKDKSFWHKPN